MLFINELCRTLWSGRTCGCANAGQRSTGGSARRTNRRAQARDLRLKTVRFWVIYMTLYDNKVVGSRLDDKLAIVLLSRSGMRSSCVSASHVGEAQSHLGFPGGALAGQVESHRSRSVARPPHAVRRSASHRVGRRGGNARKPTRARQAKPKQVEQLDFADRKIDRSLRDRARKNANEESDVIVEFVDSKNDGDDVAKQFGRQGRKLAGMNGRAMRMSNALMRRLAEQGKIKQNRPRPSRSGIQRSHVGDRGRPRRVSADGIPRHRHRRRGDRFGHHAVARRPDGGQSPGPAGRALQGLRQQPADGVRRLGPRHARRGHHRRQRL